MEWKAEKKDSILNKLKYFDSLSEINKLREIIPDLKSGSDWGLLHASIYCEDFKTNKDKSIRENLQKIENLSISESDKSKLKELNEYNYNLVKKIVSVIKENLYE